MLPKPEAPKVVKDDSPISDSTERHPAYGQIGASRVQGSAQLYGSDFNHQNFIIVRVYESTLKRGLSRDWPSSEKQLIELAMSEAQWATFVSSLNIGMGVQCTLRQVGGDTKPGILREINRKAQFSKEMTETLKEAEEAAARLEKLIAEGGKKSEMRDCIIRIRNNLAPNVKFVADQFGEHIEHVTEAAKSEVNAYIEGTLLRAGVAALNKGEQPISLPDKKD